MGLYNGGERWPCVAHGRQGGRVMVSGIERDVLTMEEIERRFHGGWVIVESVERDEHNKTVRGRVMWHGDSLDEGCEVAAQMRRPWVVIRYYGPEDPDLVFVL